MGYREGKQILELLSRRTGTVKCWFNGEGGYGFILPDEGDEAVFVHHSGIAARTQAKALKEGVRVSYEVARRKIGGMWAKDVCQAE